MDVFLSTFVMNNFPANFANAGQLKFRPEIESFVLYGVFLIMIIMLKNMKLSAGKCPLPDLDISFIYPTFAVSDESERP